MFASTFSSFTSTASGSTSSTSGDYTTKQACHTVSKGLFHITRALTFNIHKVPFKASCVQPYIVVCLPYSVCCQNGLTGWVRLLQKLCLTTGPHQSVAHTHHLHKNNIHLLKTEWTWFALTKLKRENTMCVHHKIGIKYISKYQSILLLRDFNQYSTNIINQIHFSSVFFCFSLGYLFTYDVINVLTVYINVHQQGHTQMHECLASECLSLPSRNT